jgi:phage-related protein (TIGR01555 family)
MAKKPTATKGDSLQTKQAAAKGVVARADDWENALSGYGIKGVDSRKSSTYVQSPILDEALLTDIYRGEGFGRRIVELPAQEMMRRGFKIKGDEDRKVAGVFESRGIHQRVEDMIVWSRLFGGGLGVMGLVDGGDLKVPLNEKAIKKLDFLHVFDRYRVTWTSADLYSNPQHSKFGQPQFYRVSPVNGGQPFLVHETRTLRLDGVRVPDRSRLENQGWGDAVLQSAYEQIRAVCETYGATELIMKDFITGVFKMKNLAAQLQAGNKGFLKERVESMDLTKHILNTMVVDADYEDYEKKASSVSGIPDIIDRFAMALSAVTGIPQTLLMGRSPAGMNATGESDIRGWYDQVAKDQKSLLNPIYERLIYLTFLSKECGGKEPEDWSIEWLPLWEPTEKEKAETRKTEADEMNIYYEIGAMDPREVREVIRERFNLKGDVTPPEPPPEPTPLPPEKDKKTPPDEVA